MGNNGSYHRSYSPSPEPARTHYTVHCWKHTWHNVYDGYSESSRDYYKSTSSYETCRYCISEREAERRKRAEADHQAQLERINKQNEWIQNMAKVMDDQQTKLNQLQDALEDNVKTGKFEEEITVKIADKDNPVVQIANLQKEISKNFEQLAKNANKCYMAGEYMEQSVHKFQELLKDDKKSNVPPFMPTVIKSYKSRANNMKILKTTLVVEFKNIDFKDNINIFNEAINNTKNLLDDFPSSLKSKYRLILYGEGVESIGDLVGLEKSDLVSMGIKPVHAIKILNKLNKTGEVKASFDLLCGKLTKLRNAVKTVKKAIDETEQDLNKFVKACNDLKLEFDQQLKVADIVEKISNNLDELTRIRVTEEKTDVTAQVRASMKKSGGNYAVSGAVIGAVCGGAIKGAVFGTALGPFGAADGAFCGAVIEGIIGWFCKKKRRGSSRRGSGQKSNQKYYETKAVSTLEPVDRENTQKALQKLAAVIGEMAEHNKQRFDFKDDDMKEVEDKRSELERNKATLSDIEKNLNKVEAKLNALKPNIAKLGDKGVDIDKLKTEILNVDEEIQKIVQGMDELK